MNKLSIALIAILLTGCSEKQDAFEYAKAHVWGDSFRGCDYQKILFSDDKIVVINSMKLIENRLQGSKKIEELRESLSNETAISNTEEIQLSSVESKDNNFILRFDVGEDRRRRYTMVDENIVVTGIYKNGSWFAVKDKGNNGNAYAPFSYKICDNKK